MDHCIAQLVRRRLVVKRFLTPGSILGLAIRRCVLCKDHIFRAKCQPVCSYSDDPPAEKRIVSRNPNKGALRWCD